MCLLALRVLSPIWPVQLKGSPKVRGQHLVSAPLKQAESSRLQAGWLLLTFPGPAGGAAGAHCGNRVRALSETAPPNRNWPPQTGKSPQEEGDAYRHCGVGRDHLGFSFL